MIALRIGFVVAALAAGQVDLNLGPQALAAKQAVARRLDDALVEKYAAALQEAAKAWPRVRAAKGEAAQDAAAEAVTRAAYAKVGLGEADAAVGMLVTEWVQVTSPYADAKTRAANEAGFAKRYGQATVAVLARNSAAIRAAFDALVRAENAR